MTARYDGIAQWYEEFRPALAVDEEAALRRLLGSGGGRCLDVGCGTGVSTVTVAELGWSAVGVDLSEDMLRSARSRGVDAVQGTATALPFEDASFDAAVSVWTHVDLDDFAGALREIARVLRRGAPFVYVGGHPCFLGPHSLFLKGKGVPTLHPGYRPGRRYDASAPGVANPDGLRKRVGAVHLPLENFLQAFVHSGLRLEEFEELGDRDYPHAVVVRARRPT